MLNGNILTPYLLAMHFRFPNDVYVVCKQEFAIVLVSFSWRKSPHVGQTYYRLATNVFEGDYFGGGHEDEGSACLEMERKSGPEEKEDGE